MAIPTGSFHTGHIGLNVSDLRRSREFYEAVFGFRVQAESLEEGRRFAFLEYGGALVLTLWEQSRGGFPADRPGLHHLSFQVGSLDEVRAAQERVEALGARIHHDGIVPHGEGAQSGGIFFEDPDGIRLEIFTAHGADAAPAPVRGAPTCGFF